MAIVLPHEIFIPLFNIQDIPVKTCYTCNLTFPDKRTFFHKKGADKSSDHCKWCVSDNKDLTRRNKGLGDETKCVLCHTTFFRSNKKHRFCSATCKSKFGQTYGSMKLANQYVRISGNWEKYLKRLTYRRYRQLIDLDFLLALLKKQDYKCALSRVEMTCLLQRGKTFSTNASIDRIDSTKGYEPDNVQLVCRAVNNFKVNMPQEEFIFWCREVTKNNG